MTETTNVTVTFEKTPIDLPPWEDLNTEQGLTQVYNDFMRSVEHPFQTALRDELWKRVTSIPEGHLRDKLIMLLIMLDKYTEVNWNAVKKLDGQTLECKQQ
jgi:hypothetical protein